MKTNSNQVIDQIIGLVNQLSIEEKENLLNQIFSSINKQGSRHTLRNLIMEAPTWSDDEYDDFKKAREQFNSSRLV